jgi:hypothetical protein
MATTVDLYLDWHTGSDGNAITDTIAAGSCRPASPGDTVEVYPGSTLTAMFIETDSASPVSGLVTCDSVTYDIGDTTQGAKYDHTSNYEDMVTASVSSNPNVMSMGGLFKTDINDEWEWHALQGMVGSGEWALVAPRYYEGAMHLFMHTSQGYSVADIEIELNTWYWVTLQYNATTGYGYLAVYDPSTWEQVGSTVSKAFAASPSGVSYWTVGQHASQGNTEAASTWYGPTVFDWTDGTFPLLPTAATPTLTQTQFRFFDDGDELPHMDAAIVPVIEAGDITASGNNTAETSPDIAYPAHNSGDLIIQVLVSDADAAHTSEAGANGPNGETIIDIVSNAETGGSNGPHLSVSYWVASANTAGGNQVWTIASEQWVGFTIVVPAGEFYATTPIGTISSVGTNNDNAGTADTPAFTPNRSGGRIVAVGGVDADPMDASYAPSGWTGRHTQDIGAVSCFCATRDTLSVASSEVAAASFGINTSDSYTCIAFVVNGTVSTADGRTPLAAAGTDPTLDVDTDYGVSIRVENSGGATTEDTYKWQYKKGAGSWTDISSSSSVVKASATADFANGADVAEYITGSGTYVTNNNAALDTTGSLTLAAVLGASNSFESHLNFQIVSADVADEDVIYLRIVYEAGTAFDSYGTADTNIPAITVNKAGTTHSAAGTAGGTSGASSSGRVLRPAKASAVAVSTAVAVACVLKAVIGVAGGTSDVAAKAYQEFSAKGAVASTSGATASGTIGYSVAGEARGTSAVTGAASVLKPVAGTAGGTSGATGAASVLRPAAGTAGGTSGATGVASVLRPAAGTAGGTSGATSSASVLKPVAGVIAATSSATAAGTVTEEGGETHSAAGEVAGVSAVTGAAGVLHGDAVDFTLNVQSAITYAAATADGTSGADGVASVLKPVAGAAGGASTAEARGTADYSAVGAIAAVSSVTGTANANETHSAAAEVAATSSATAAATTGVGTTTAFNIKIQGAVVSAAGSIAATSTATATATEYGTGYMWAKINGTWVGIGSLTAGGGFPPTDGDVDGGTW